MSTGSVPPQPGSLFDAWIERGGESTIAAIADVLRIMLGHQAGACTMGGGCANYIGFDPDGSVWPCCEMALKPRFELGNILQASLPEILNGPVANAFWDERDLGNDAGEGCQW